MQMHELLGNFRDALTPKTRLSPGGWCERYVKLEDSSQSSYFDLSSTPWFEEPMREIVDNRNKEICVTAPVGCGKSTMVEGLLCYLAGEDPGPTLVVGQTDPDICDWAETRLWPTMKNCQPLEGIIPVKRNKVRKSELLIDGMPIHLTGANLSGLQSKSKRWCIGDEVWMWQPGFIGQLRARTHRRWNGRVVLLGQAGIVRYSEDGEIIGDDFTAAHSLGEQREWGFSCPACDQWQPYRVSQLKYPEKGTTHQRASKVQYECEQCLKRWPDVGEVRRNLSSRSCYQVLKAASIPGHISFHLNVLALWRNPWSDFVIQWITANEARKRGNIVPLKLLIQKELAEPWQEELSIVRKDLCRVEARRSDYAEKQKLEGEVVRFATIDVQRDHYWIVIRLWRGDSSSLGVFYSRVETDETLDLLVKKYDISPNQVFIDASFDSGRVYDLVVKYGWCGVKGTDRENFTHVRGKAGKTRKLQRFYSEMKSAAAPAGGRARYFFLCVNQVKDLLQTLREGGGSKWEVVDDIGRDYEEGIDSELKEEFLRPKTNQPQIKWVRKKRNNHPWDCETYQVGAALIWGLF